MEIAKLFQLKENLKSWKQAVFPNTCPRLNYKVCVCSFFLNQVCLNHFEITLPQMRKDVFV